MAVAYPRSTEQVSAIARICHRHGVPIIPYSGGSSLEGNFSAPYGGVSVDFAYMDRIVQFNKDDMDIVVQPSIGWQDLNAQLSSMGSGLFFPIDPGALSFGSLFKPPLSNMICLLLMHVSHCVTPDPCSFIYTSKCKFLASSANIYE